jgi:hypothetical protein
MFSPAAQGQNWNKLTRVTFSQPVEIPGISAQILPAGTYVFRLLDSLSDRHIVQIFNEDQSHLYANILAIPNYRLRPTDETVITFSERAAGTPQAIRAWFYPGDNSGQEFVYPKSRAVELAKLSNQPVLSMPTELGPSIVAPLKTATEAPAVALREAPLEAVRPTGEVVALSEVVIPPPVQTASASQTTPAAPAAAQSASASRQATTLPKTATSLPLLALMGFLSVGLGLSCRVLCRRG